MYANPAYVRLVRLREFGDDLQGVTLMDMVAGTRPQSGQTFSAR